MKSMEVLVLVALMACFVTRGAAVAAITRAGPRTAFLAENSPAGTFVTLASASDPDGGAFTFVIQNVNPMAAVSYFTASNTGVITVASGQTPDREAAPAGITFNLVLMQSGSAQGMVPVTVILRDVNDNPPVWNNDPGMPLRFSETLRIGSLIRDLNVTDADSGLNGNIIFTLTAPIGGPFSVGRISGLVTLTSSLDYETQTSFTITIVAQDQGNPSMSTTITLTVNVLDQFESAPMFTRDMYSVSLAEGSYAMPQVLGAGVVRAAHPEGGTVRYRYRPSDIITDGLFSVGPMSGDATVQGTLDRELNNIYSFGVDAYIVDPADASVIKSETAIAFVVVTVTDVNDNPPTFLNSRYSSYVTEAAQPGHIVVSTSAFDLDEGTNAVFQYQKAASASGVPFNINPSSGTITVSGSLDYETTPFYSFTVQAVDDGPSPRTGMAQVTVDVTNVNDNVPIISDPAAGSVTVSLSEEATPPQTVLTVTASDADGDTLQYTLTQTSTFFTVDSSGVVTTTMTLDRETMATHSFTVQVCDSDPAHCDSVSVTVNVTDINDHAPVFESTSYSATVSECAPVNSALATVVARDTMDIGVNAIVFYEVVSGDTSRLSLDRNTGRISLTSQTVDYESGSPSYSLTIRARDNPSSTPKLTAANNAVFTLMVIDCNDLPPVFTQTNHSFTISERSAAAVANEDVYTSISVTDQDGTAANRMVNYWLAGSLNSTNNWFNINSVTGNIFIRSGVTVDREDPSLHIDSLGHGVLTFNILAVNDAPTGTFTATATVTVRITDINDNSPVIQQMGPIGREVVAHTPNGTQLAVISATDADYGDNSHIIYNISSGNTGNKFAIDRDNGTIYVNGDLNVEGRVPSFILIVSAENDLATGAAPDTITVVVTVVTTNFHRPRFNNSRYNATVMEYNALTGAGMAAGSTVAEVLATDLDSMDDPAGQIEYTIISGNQLGIFDIPNPISGTVTVVRPDMIDHETTSQFDLVVTATDLVVPESRRRQDSTHLVITVIDANDNIPIFLDNEYYGTVREELPSGSTVTVIPTIRVFDADQDGNAVLYYHLLGGSTTSTLCDGVFCIHPTTGGIYLRGALDRETEDLYILQAAVSNHPNLTFNGTSPQNATTAPVAVTVEDVNDNPPQFVSTSLTGSVAEEAEFGTIVTTIMVTDADIGSGQVVWFEFMTPQVPFLVNRDSGVVTTSGVFTGLSGTRYNVTIRAYDNKGIQPSLSTTTSLVIQVFKMTEQLILTYDCQKENVEANIDQIHSALASIIQDGIDITQVRVKRTDDGTVDVTRSDVIFFALNSATGEVTHPAVVLQIIDQSGVAALDQAAGPTCTVEGIRIWPPSESEARSEVVPIWVWPVIAVMAVVILFVCCCFLCGLVVERRRNRRLKKRDMPDQYSQFTSEVSMNNPLWVAPFDNWDRASTTEPSSTQVDRPNPLYESQEITIEMFQDDDEDLSTGSCEHLVKAPPLTSSTPARESTYSGADDDELLAEAIGEERKGGPGSQTSLV